MQIQVKAKLKINHQQSTKMRPRTKFKDGFAQKQELAQPRDSPVAGSAF